MKPTRIFLFLFIFLNLLLQFSCSSKKTNPAKPNILFIMVDDLRDWTGYSTAFSNVITPHLNQLAKEGLVFNNAYCAAPVCSPSRTALLSGLSPARTGVYENGQRLEDELQNTVTLTQKFMEADYFVAGFGKIYHGQGKGPYWHEYIYGDYSPLPEEYESYYALGNPLQIPDSLTGDWKRVTNAIKVLEKDTEKPLFLACGLVRPHTPWNVPQKYFDLYEEGSIEIPEILDTDLEDIPEMGKRIAARNHKDNYGKSIEWTHQAIVDSGLWKTNIRAYLASVTYADAQIGRLLEAWRNSKYSENGIVVLMGDHGWHHGEKKHWSKRTLWEVGTRTPLIISGTGFIPKNNNCTQPVNLLDIYPTLIDFCNLEPDNNLDGASLKPLIQNPDADWLRPAVTIWGKDNVSVRSKKWRYIRYCDGTEELYNLEKDKNEWENLVYTDRNLYSEVIENLEKYLPECKEPASFSKKRISWFDSEDVKRICP